MNGQSSNGQLDPALKALLLQGITHPLERSPEVGLGRPLASGGLASSCCFRVSAGNSVVLNDFGIQIGAVVLFGGLLWFDLFPRRLRGALREVASSPFCRNFNVSRRLSPTGSVCSARSASTRGVSDRSRFFSDVSDGVGQIPLQRSQLEQSEAKRGG